MKTHETSAALGCGGSLDVLDVLCFQNAFSSGRSYADCDNDRDLTVLDFLCFQKRFEEASR